jgi:5-methylcytosine-specific restriction protein A
MSQKEDKMKIYNSKEWRLVRDAKRQRDPLCEVCKHNGKVVRAQCVHHIIPIETALSFGDMKRLAYQFTNLISLCYDCHAKIHEALNSHTREGHQRSTANAVERWAKSRNGDQTESDGDDS